MDYGALCHYDGSIQVPSAGTGDCEQALYWEESNPYILPTEETIPPGAIIPGTVLPGSVIPGAEVFNEEFAGIEFQETRTILSDAGFGISSVNFDDAEELLWVGNQGGHVTSYYGSTLQKYTSFQVNATQEVRQIHCMDEGILVLTQNMLRCQLRRGVPIFSETSVNMTDMQCMLQVSPTRLLIGGHQKNVIDFNLSTGKETDLIPVGKDGCAILRSDSRWICMGNPVGRIDFRDPVSLSMVHALNTHSGSLSDFDVQGNYLVTCGFSNGHQGLTVDRFIKVYDLRQMKPLTPVCALIYPLLLKFLPNYSNRIAVVSPIGEMQLLDTVYAFAQLPVPFFYQIGTAGAMVLSLDISSTSQCLCIGDSAGTVHLMSANTPEPRFNTISRPTDFVDPAENLPPIDIDDNSVPLSTIPLSYTPQSLLSDWPEEFTKKEYRKPLPIDGEILRTMKMQGNIGYAPNPKAHRKTQIHKQYSPTFLRY